MTSEQILLRKDAIPFRPFEICLTDGRVLAIPHPDFLSVTEGDELAHVFDLKDGIETIDLLLVVSLRSPAKSAAKTAS